MSDGKRVLGIDYGESKIGLAVSDELGLTAQPLSTIRRRSSKQDLAELAEIIERLDVREIVMGLPRNMDGTYGEGVRRVKLFAKTLVDILGVAVTLWDERLSTRAAQRTMAELGTKRTKKKEAEDKLSAQFILQGYLDSKRAKGSKA